jgi:hypothetical protein
MINIISDHIQAARDRLITQYKDAPNLIAILDSLTTQIQDLENAYHSLFLGRWIENAEGLVLDDFGTIVGQAREGFDDDFYKILLYVKIGENISQGETERVISIYKIITRATRVMLGERYPAGVDLLSNGTINPITAQFIMNRLQRVVGAGIRVDHIGHFHPTTPFGFLGAPDAAGFNVGEWAYLYNTSPFFSFKNPNRADISGFGTLSDHVYGGKFI